MKCRRIVESLQLIERGTFFTVAMEKPREQALWQPSFCRDCNLFCEDIRCVALDFVAPKDLKA